MRKLFVSIALLGIFAIGYTQNGSTDNPNSELRDPVIMRLFSSQGPYRDLNPSTEIISERTEESKVFLNENGTRKALIGAGPVHYLENGQYKTSSNEIISYTSALDANIQFANIHNAVKTYYGILSEGVSTQLSNNTILKSYRPTGFSQLDANLQPVSETQKFEQNTLPQNKWGKFDGEILYPQVSQGIDFHLNQLSSSFKSNYVIESLSSLGNLTGAYVGFEEIFEFDQEVHAQLNPDRTNVDFINADGKTLVRYSEGKYFDANGSVNLPGPKLQFDVQQISDREYRVYLLVPVAWLNDPLRAFPVTVDPVVNCVPNNAIYWTGSAANAGSPTNSAQLNLGFYDCAGCTDEEWQAYTKFNISTIPDASCNMSSAVVYLWQLGWTNGGGNDGLQFDVGWANIEPVSASWAAIVTSINNIERYSRWDVWGTPGACAGCIGGYDYNEGGTNSWVNMRIDYNLARNRIVSQLGADYMTFGLDLIYHADDCGSCFGDETNMLYFAGYNTVQRPQLIVDYNVPSTTPASITTSANNVCPGTNITLTRNGGTAGTGNNWRWYSGSCGGTLLGTGDNINVAPTTTTTYYLRGEGNCGNTTCASLTINVNTNSVVPAAITGTSTICLGGSGTTLTLSGGTAGTGATAQWFTGSCGGTAAGTGNSIIVNPTVNTTYYVRYAGTCNTTTCASQLVTITNPSSAGVVTGDYVWRGATSTDWGTASNWWTWNGSAFSVAAGTPGATNSVFIEPGGTCVPNNPTVTTGDILHLTIRPSGILTHSGSGALNIRGNYTNNGTYNFNTGVVNLIGTANGTISGSGTLDFYALNLNKTVPATISLSNNIRVRDNFTATSGLMTTGANRLEVGVNTATPGTISYTGGTVEGYIKKWYNSALGGTQFPVGNTVSGTVYNRWAQINYTTAPSAGGSLTVRFIGTPAPMYTGLPLNDAGVIIQNFANEGYWEVTPGDGLTGGIYSITLRGNNFAAVNNLSTLRVIKSPGTHTTWTLDGMHGTSTGTLTDPVVSRNGLSGYSWFTIGSPNMNPLPIELISFEANCADGKIQLNWATASEENNSYFIIERSSDGHNWEESGRVLGAGNSNITLNYSFTDPKNANGLYYYRLTQVDYDGLSERFTPISVSCYQNGGSSILIYPNPARNETTVRIVSEKEVGTAKLILTNVLGNRISEQTIIVHQGENKYMVSGLENLPSGTYPVSVEANGLSLPVSKLVIAK